MVQIAGAKQDGAKRVVCTLRLDFQRCHEPIQCVLDAFRFAHFPAQDHICRRVRVTPAPTHSQASYLFAA